MADGVALFASAFNTVSGVESQQRQASAASASGQYAKRVDEENARQLDFQAQDATERGQVAAQRRGLAGRQELGSSRAALAAQGVDVSSGSAADVQASEAGLTAADEVTLRNNAAREAWGYKVEAINERQAGQVAAITGDSAAAGYRAASWGTALSGAAQTYGLYSQYSKDRKDTRQTQDKVSTNPRRRY
jgi:hypothetical protein